MNVSRANAVLIQMAAGNDSVSFDQQLAELSGLLGGDLNAPQFLQEMLMLQMQVR